MNGPSPTAGSSPSVTGPRIANRRFEPVGDRAIANRRFEPVGNRADVRVPVGSVVPNQPIPVRNQNVVTGAMIVNHRFDFAHAPSRAPSFKCRAYVRRGESRPVRDDDEQPREARRTPLKTAGHSPFGPK
jgi:hypothetical protein